YYCSKEIPSEEVCDPPVGGHGATKNKSTSVRRKERCTKIFSRAPEKNIKCHQMNENNETQPKRSGYSKIAILISAIIAIGAIVLAVYTFQQKTKADELAQLAMQKAREATEQQKIAVEQINKADSTQEQLIMQTETANENARIALQEKEKADSQAKIAKMNEQIAIIQKHEAEEQKANAERQRLIAEANAAEVVVQKKQVSEEKNKANIKTIESKQLKDLLGSRNIANESVLLLNENLVDSSRHKAMLAYQLNIQSQGPKQNNDIYNALNLNWTKSIGYKNQVRTHEVPVRCITGMPNSNIVFTADEGGTLYEWAAKNNGLEKVAAYSIKEEVRAIAISPDGSKLVAITFAGNGIVLKASASGISLLSNFKFPGFGKAIVFTDAQSFAILSSKGIGKYDLQNIAASMFVNREGINAFTMDAKGKFYTASGNTVSIYISWDDLMKGNAEADVKYDSRVTSMAVDAGRQYIAAGTYNGFVCLVSLKSKAVLWNRALHLSSVNDLKFSMANNILQLASAGADQTIKIVDVKDMQQNPQEDILSLKGHTKWIYALYYTPDGQWLLSAGGDNKVIAWKPTMDELYKALSN
ncbi:MAG TPA: hypothetical protein PL045_02970, partial [Chitinophagaceae bacterium]|nr:hypothetical protein [Chitinophagaceae bacterium]